MQEVIVNNGEKRTQVTIETILKILKQTSLYLRNSKILHKSFSPDPILESCQFLLFPDISIHLFENKQIKNYDLPILNIMTKLYISFYHNFLTVQMSAWWPEHLSNNCLIKL